MEEQRLEDKINLPGGVTVKTLMKPWTEQASYPLITVTIENSDVLIKQVSFHWFQFQRNEHYLITLSYFVQEPYNDYSGYNESWIVPITYGTSADDLKATAPMEWLNPDEQIILDKAVEPGQWIIVNLGQSGRIQ